MKTGILAHLGRTLIAISSTAILLVTGVAYAENTYQPTPPLVDAVYTR